MGVDSKQSLRTMLDHSAIEASLTAYVRQYVEKWLLGAHDLHDMSGWWGVSYFLSYEYFRLDMIIIAAV